MEKSDNSNIHGLSLAASWQDTTLQIRLYVLVRFKWLSIYLSHTRINKDLWIKKIMK
jgi:hypothetical protein